MRTMKKNGKRWLAMVLSLVMCSGLLQTTSFAANWSPGDKITINVRVYDESTGAVYNVGTDSVEKGNPELIQSVNYRIPLLTKFVNADRFGRVSKVVGNWYFPAGDSQPGASVEWSCNANSVTMTYWVNWYKTGSGSGSGSDQDTTVNIGSGGRYSWTQYITYHSNYPDGTSYSYKVTYKIQSYTATYNDWSCIKSLADVKFSTPNGYEAKSPIWNTSKAGTGTGYAPGSQYTFQQANNGKNLDLYAQWQPTGGTEVTPVTLTYMDGSAVYGIRNYFAGDTATAILCTTEKTGYTFAGWDTDSSAQTVKYRAGIEFTINSNMTLYAVWTPDVPTTTTLTVKKLVAGDLNDTQLPSTFSMTATIINGSTVKNIFLNSAKLEDSVEISTTAATTVVLNESGYAVDEYDCTATASNGSAVVNGNVTIMVPAGTMNPICSITNTYVSNVEPAKQLTGFTKTRLTSVPAELGLTGINTDTPVRLKVGESATLLYAITVTGDEGASYTITDPTAEAVDPNAMSGTIGSTGKATVYVTMTIDIDDVVEGYVENTAYVEAGVNTDLGDITPTVSEATNVIGELTGGKRYDDAEDGTIDFTVEVTNKIGATLSSLKLTDTMQKISMIMGEDENPSYTIKLYSQSGEEITPVVSSVTSDGRETVWYIEGPIPQDAKVVLTYSGKIDSTVVEGEKWKNSVFPEYTTEEGAMVYGDFEFVGTAEGNWVPSGMFSCEGVVGE